MRILTDQEVLLVKLEISPEDWQSLNRLYETIAHEEFQLTQVKSIGLTVEQFDRESPFADKACFGVDTQFGPIISVWTAFAPMSVCPFRVMFLNNKRTYAFRRSFTFEAERDRFLLFDQPFKTSEQFA